MASGDVGRGGLQEEDDDDERVALLTDSGHTSLVSGGHVPVSVVRGSSWYASVFLVVNAALGAGLLNFPASYDRSGGILVAIIIQAVLMVFIVGALIILAFCSDLQHSATYQDTVHSMCGRGAQTVCALCIALYAYGSCITFFIIIADQIDKFLNFVHGPDYCITWYMNRSFTMTSSCILLILPLCFPKRIDFLKYASVFGVIGVVYCVVLVSGKYFIGPINPGTIKTDNIYDHIRTTMNERTTVAMSLSYCGEVYPPPQEKCHIHRPTNWMDAFLVVPVICFGYQCHVSIIPIYSCMRQRNLRDFTKTILVALSVCILAYTGTASFGYLTFGSRVNEDILLSYQPTWDVLVAVALIAAKMYTTYPILLFVGRAAAEGMLVRLMRTPPEVVVQQELVRRVLLTLIWFCTTLVLAVFVPNIGVVISVLGGLASTFIFIFPGMCLLQVLLQGHVDSMRQRITYRLLMAMAVGYLIIGAFLFGITVTQALLTDISSKAHSNRNKYGCL